MLIIKAPEQRQWRPSLLTLNKFYTLSPLLPSYRNQSTYNFIEKETLAQVFFCEFCEISKKPSSQNISGWLLLQFVTLYLIALDN